MSKRSLSRRQFLIGAAAAIGASALSLGSRRVVPAVSGQDPIPTPGAFLPYVARNHARPLPALPGRVVRVHNLAATHWQGEDDYWNHVDQEAVNSMVDRGLMELTGQGSAARAWRSLLPAYQPGEKVAIKVNFNNSSGCHGTLPNIDAILEPVNALARGLIELGVAPADIGVYDAVRAMPDHFVDKDLYGLSFYDHVHQGTCRNPAGFDDVPETAITFYPPEGVDMPPEHVTDVLMAATYLINVPIMKGSHPLAGVTLGFKNHFGTIHDCAALHEYVNVVGLPPGYRTDYNPLVDLMRSPLIGGKCILTVGDALFAARHYSQPPELWITFGGQVPNSLLFATDPVAIDCVMHDLIAAEPDTNVPDGANNYVRLAGEAGLGVFEHGDPWGSGYSTIQYVRVEM